MRRITIALAFTLTPALLVAQVSTSTEARAGASVQTKRAAVNADGSVKAQAAADAAIPNDFSTAGRARLEAAFRDARAKRLPEQPMRDRIAEGRAKAAGEARIVAEVQRLETRLDASQRAMVKAGRSQTADAEIVSGARAMEHGVTSAQISAVARHAAPGHDLTVALDVLGKLAARGVPVTQAVAEVQGKLDARASDDAIASLATSVDATGALGAGKAAVGANAAAGVKGAVTGVGATVGGTVGGVLGKKP